MEVFTPSSMTRISDSVKWAEDVQTRAPQQGGRAKPGGHGIVAKILTNEGLGAYTAQQQYWTGTAWADLTSGRTFDGSNAQEIIEIGLSATIKVGALVDAFPIPDTLNKRDQWFFDACTLTGAGYDGPFKVVQASSTSVQVGPDRADADYKNKDVITIVQDDGELELVDRTPAGAEAVSSITTSVYLYMELERGSAAYDYTLKTTATWPPTDTATTKDTIPILVSYAKCAGSVIVSVSQLLRGCPMIWERPTLADGEATYKNDNMLVAGMTVNIGGVSKTMNAVAYPLDTDTDVYVEAKYTIATGAWVITDDYQDGLYIPYSDSSGVETYHWRVAAVVSGKKVQHRIGSIEYPHGPGNHNTAPGTYQSWATDHDGKKEWHPTGFWAEIVSETGGGVYAMRALDKASLTFSATEQQGAGGIPSGDYYYVQQSASGTHYFVASALSSDEMVSAESGETPGYLDEVIVDGDDDDYDTDTDVPIAADGSTESDKLQLYAQMDEVDYFDGLDPVGVFIHVAGTIRWAPGIEISAALKLVPGHGNSKTMKTTAVGAPEWETV